MAFSPSTVVAPLSAPRPRVDLADFDHDFGYMVDESDLGLWSSDREAGMDWDVYGACGYESDESEDQVFDGFDCMSTFDADDYEYQQALLY